MEKAPEDCILCGTKEREPLIGKDPWQIHRCKSCGLGLLDPRPSSTELKGLYSEAYFADQYDTGLEPGTAEFKKRLSAYTSHIRFFRGMKRKGRLLDMGCGYGYFLAACRERGYEVHGLDISDWSATYATQKLGLPITVGEIEEVELPSQSFDIITLWHFLEHTSDPVKTVLRAKNWLKKDGVLVVDVPNYQSTDASRNWQDWVGWQPPFHFYHFTPPTLKSLLNKCGFQVVKSKTYHSEVVKGRLKRIPVLSLFARLISKLYSGHSVAVVSVMDKDL